MSEINCKICDGGVRTVYDPQFKTDYYCLATLELVHKDDQIHIINEHGPTLKGISHE